MKRNEDIWTLAANYLSGEMNDSERKKFERMLHKNQSMNDDFKKIQISWDHLTANKTTDSQSAWNKLYERLENDKLVETSKTSYIGPFNYLIKVAAMVIMVAVFSFATFYILSDRNISTVGYSSFQASESVRSFTLPEGSRVLLNKGAMVYYSDDFNKNRKVKLEGEGFFEVMSDPANPFQIETSKALITVLGTKFNVKENNEARTTEVFVESGKVKLNAKQKSDGIFLENGDFGSSNGNTEQKLIKNDLNYLSWKTREFHFTNQSIASVIEVLQKSYHVEISVNDKEINELMLTSSYKEQSIDAILNTIGIAFDLDLKLEKGKYILSLK